MIETFLAALALQANPYEAFNPTIPYTQCMRRGLSARLSGDPEIEAGRRVAAFEQSLAECAGVRASALARLDLMLSRMAASDGTPPDPRFNGTIMMNVWDKAFRELAMDPGHDWRPDQAGKPSR